MTVPKEIRHLRLPYIIDNICHIPLNNGEEALCDSCFYDKVIQYVWHLHKGKVVTDIKDDNRKYHETLLHSFLFPDFELVFFINGNKKDHRTQNIRTIRRECWVEENICYIPLQHGKIAICDADRYDEVSKFCWYYAKNIYARTKINGNIVQLHNFLFPQFKIIDHKNRNRLDNRSENIREASISQNCANVEKRKNTRFKYKGCRTHPSGKVVAIL